MNNQPVQHDPTLLRLGTVTAIAGVLVALVQTAIDPAMPDDPAAAISQAAHSHQLAYSRVLDAVGFLLLLAAAAIATKLFTGGPGAAWARIGLVFMTVAATTGITATMIVGSLPDIAAAWATAPNDRRPGYIAVSDSLRHITGAMFSAGWMALGMFALFFAVAIAKHGQLPRSLTWVAAAAGLAALTSTPLGVIGVPIAFPLLLVGLLLNYVVLVTCGIKLWQLAAALPATRRDRTAHIREFTDDGGRF